MSVDLLDLQRAPFEALVEQADALGIDAPGHMRRGDLVFEIARVTGSREGNQYGRGVLEVHGEGFGFLRSPSDNYLPGNDDIYVSQSQIRRFKLQTGDTVVGIVRPPKEGERYTALLRVELVNGEPPGMEPPAFDGLTAVHPAERIALDGHPFLRPLDLVAPLGLGQRGILVAPQRAGSTEVLRHLADVLTATEELEVVVLLLDERPEEIVDWRRGCRAELVATPFDEAVPRHLQVTDIVFERARRMVERGDDVVILVDSLTRLLRACLAELPGTGRTVGGVDTAALHRVRRYLGAARALEEGGSLTVIGVVSGDPGSVLDQALLDDLRDVVNWEVTLCRELADRGVRPAIDVHRSGTRRPERMLSDEEIEHRARWRAALTGDTLKDGVALVVTRPQALDSLASTK